ncbi:type III-A CRISPR-associated RAMP protein Csm3 [candidate division NPL-UPA2 bacterium]|nr:type III-A CRISPR-associated RAMP protein Csm3 [candidate division NPL-UPA2 bacterium]
MLDTKPLWGKIVLQGVMKCETGLHIGASRDTLEIGRTDSLVARNPLTKEPYIPGSSLKGKLRSLLERIKQKEDKKKYAFDRKIESGKRHECDTANLDCEVCRLFGSTARGKHDKNHPARLIIRDLHPTAMTMKRLQKMESDLLHTERKWENVLDRVTAAATPRQIERIPAESEFFFEIIYSVEVKDKEVIKKDISNIFQALSALELDALGGHGSRGYGRVSFKVATFESLPPEGRDYLTWEELKKLSLEKTANLTDLDESKKGIDRIADFPFPEDSSGNEKKPEQSE